MWGNEAVMLPMLDVAAPFRTWGAQEFAIDGWHHVAYATATGIADEQRLASGCAATQVFSRAMSHPPQVEQSPLIVCLSTTACTWLPQPWHAQRTSAAPATSPPLPDPMRPRRELYARRDIMMVPLSLRFPALSRPCSDPSNGCMAPPRNGFEQLQP
ncbi:MAG: hypothetical protein ACRDKY_11940 [Solirubrobacteraceae bacterium]